MNNDPAPDDAPETSPEHEKPVNSPWTFRIQVALVLALLLAIFYVEENWRGKRAWAKTKAALEASGEKLDWFDYVPKAPPPEENVFKAPGMEELLIRGRGENVKLSSVPPTPTNGPKATNYFLFGLLEFVPKNASGIPKDALVFDFDALKADPLAVRDLSIAFGGKIAAAPQGIAIIQKPLGRDVKRIFVRADEVPNSDVLAGTLDPKTTLTDFLVPARIEVVSSNVFGLVTTHWSENAEDFLEWSNQEHKEVFATLQEAVKRPRVWLPGDYTNPAFSPIQNFVHARVLAQTRAARAQSYMLLGRADEAYEEIRRIDDLKRVMRSEPITLVGAMIHVAIAGLQSSVIADGFAAGIWGEKHLQGFQLIDPEAALLPPIARAMRGGERAAGLYMVENLKRSDMFKVFEISGPDKRSSFNPVAVLYRVMPRGWIYLNMSQYAKLMQIQVERAEMLQGLAKKRGQWLQSGEEIETILSQKSPSMILSAVAIPNFQKAGQTALKNEMLQLHASIAAGLERHRLAKGGYPESLDLLVPQFLEKAPIDSCSGKPMRYEKRANGEYALYSVGIDGQDDLASALADPNRPMREILASASFNRDWIWHGIPENIARPAAAQGQK